MHATVASTQALAGQLAAFMGEVLRSSAGGWLQAVADLDLSMTQVKAMQVIADDPRSELSVGDVAGALSLSLAATSRALDGLHQRGLIERRESAEDRRSRLVRVSEEGRAAYARVIEARLAGLAAFLGTLSPAERDALGRAIAPIAERTRS
jgi:DNA-binding MarR family transcriptional regulator